MAHRDGDGWIQCDCAGKHWGLFGAAGLVLIRDQSILMQHRAPWVHNGDTWGIPGGARDSHETALEAALREANEEIGIDILLLTVINEFVDDHGPWRYHTIIAKADPKLIAHEMNDESLEVKWIPIAEVENQILHPSFAKTWPQLKPKLLL
jgi:8-oxo-dGTP diphosphatase